MKPCQFMLALSLFCGGIHNTSTNGWCGFFPGLIEQGGGERLFSEPKVHEACEEQTGVVCQGWDCSPGRSSSLLPPSAGTRGAGWESGVSKWTPDPSDTAELSLHNKQGDLDSAIGIRSLFPTLGSPSPGSWTWQKFAPHFALHLHPGSVSLSDFPLKNFSFINQLCCQMSLHCAHQLAAVPFWVECFLLPLNWQNGFPCPGGPIPGGAEHLVWCPKPQSPLQAEQDKIINWDINGVAVYMLCTIYVWKCL